MWSKGQTENLLSSPLFIPPPFSTLTLPFSLLLPPFSRFLSECRQPLRGGLALRGAQAQVDAPGLGPRPPLLDICQNVASLSRRMSERLPSGCGTSLAQGRVRKRRLLGLDVLLLFFLQLFAMVTRAVEP